MRVAIIIPRLAQFGPIKVMHALVNNLCKNSNLQINVYYLDSKIDREVEMMAKVEKLSWKTFPFSDYDIIHTNGIRPDFFAWINRKKIKYHISTIHNLVFEDLSFTYNKLISRIFGNIWLVLWRRADKLVCVSETMKNYYKKWFSSSKLEVIYNGIPHTVNSMNTNNDVYLKVEEFKHKGYKIIVSACIITKGKNIDQLLQLISLEREYAAIIFGEGKQLATLKKLAKDLKITERCIFPGFRSNAVYYFHYCDVFIMPSKSEGFGLALIEAAQQKIPAVCSDIPVFKELFSAEEVTFFSLSEMASLISAIEEANIYGKQKAALAYSRYQNNYTADIMDKRYSSLYKDSCL